MKNLIYFFIGSVLMMAGCENKDLLQSEKKIREQLEAHTWKRIQAKASEDTDESWTFKDGKLTIFWDKNSNDLIDTNDIHIVSNYTVSTKFSSSYVSFTGIPLPPHHTLVNIENVNLNLRWTIAEINEKVLYLSASTDAGTIKSLEYIKE